MKIQELHPLHLNSLETVKARLQMIDKSAHREVIQVSKYNVLLFEILYEFLEQFVEGETFDGDLKGFREAAEELLVNLPVINI